MRTVRKKKSHTKMSGEKISGSLPSAIAMQSSFYREVVAEREEILRHKWFLSEQAGYDVGFSTAAYDWISKHRTAWRKSWRERNGAPSY